MCHLLSLCESSFTQANQVASQVKITDHVPACSPAVVQLANLTTIWSQKARSHKVHAFHHAFHFPLVLVFQHQTPSFQSPHFPASQVSCGVEIGATFCRKSVRIGSCEKSHQLPAISSPRSNHSSPCGCRNFDGPRFVVLLSPFKKAAVHENLEIAMCDISTNIA